MHYPDSSSQPQVLLIILKTINMLAMEGLGSLGALEEHNNAGALLGIDGPDGEELLGALRRMNPIRRQRTINKLASSGAPSRGSRAEMEKHFNEVPDYIQEGLKSGDLRLADTMIYSIKPVTSRTIKMWETQDDKEVGLRNISNAKLPKNQCLMVSGITLLAGVGRCYKRQDRSGRFQRAGKFPGYY